MFVSGISEVDPLARSVVAFADKLIRSVIFDLGFSAAFEGIRTALCRIDEDRSIAVVVCVFALFLCFTDDAYGLVFLATGRFFLGYDSRRLVVLFGLLGLFLFKALEINSNKLIVRDSTIC